LAKPEQVGADLSKPRTPCSHGWIIVNNGFTDGCQRDEGKFHVLNSKGNANDGDKAYKR